MIPPRKIDVSLCLATKSLEIYILGVLGRHHRPDRPVGPRRPSVATTAHRGEAIGPTLRRGLCYGRAQPPRARPSAPGASGEALACLAEATCARKGTGGGSPRPRGLGWSSSGSLAANGVAEMTFFTISFFSSTKLAHVIVPKFNLGFLGPNPTGGTKFRVGNYFL